MEVNEQLKNFIVEHIGVSETKITLEASLVDDLGFDDLDRVEMALELEDELDIEITDEKLEAFVTVGDVNEFLKTFDVGTDK